MYHWTVLQATVIEIVCYLYSVTENTLTHIFHFLIGEGTFFIGEGGDKPGNFGEKGRGLPLLGMD